MKIIHLGNRYDVYTDGIKAYDKLPADTYRISMDNSGMFLVRVPGLTEIGEKVYGSREHDVKRVFQSFEITNRSMGVLLTGDKGIGKSLFARMSSLEGIKRELPVIIIDRYLPGIPQFIATIEQEVIILMDEFEKIFSENQEEFLGLFDGISAQKRLFLVTANRLSGLSEYFINRPGRFHYHFRFEYPNEDEIKEYLSDNLSFGREHINDISDLSLRVSLNYDMLRAIAFDLNQGYELNDALSVLNILNQPMHKRFRYTLVPKNGTALLFESSFVSESELDTGYVYDDLYFNIVAGGKSIGRINIELNGAKMKLSKDQYGLSSTITLNSETSRIYAQPYSFERGQLSKEQLSGLNELEKLSGLTPDMAPFNISMKEVRAARLHIQV